MRKKKLYPGIDEAEQERINASKRAKVEREANEEPDWKNGAPNYDKFQGWDTEKVLMWLNID